MTRIMHNSQKQFPAPKRKSVWLDGGMKFYTVIAEIPNIYKDFSPVSAFTMLVYFNPFVQVLGD